jgi:hypothetical protein
MAYFDNGSNLYTEPCIEILSAYIQILQQFFLDILYHTEWYIMICFKNWIILIPTSNIRCRKRVQEESVDVARRTARMLYVFEPREGNS